MPEILTFRFPLVFSAGLPEGLEASPAVAPSAPEGSPPGPGTTVEGSDCRLRRGGAGALPFGLLAPPTPPAAGLFPVTPAAAVVPAVRSTPESGGAPAVTPVAGGSAFFFDRFRGAGAFF